jgi:hypothetical protein
MSIQWEAVSALSASRRILHLPLDALYNSCSILSIMRPRKPRTSQRSTPPLVTHFIVTHCYIFVF